MLSTATHPVSSFDMPRDQTLQRSYCSLFHPNSVYLKSVQHKVNLTLETVKTPSFSLQHTQHLGEILALTLIQLPSARTCVLKWDISALDNQCLEPMTHKNYSLCTPTRRFLEKRDLKTHVLPISDFKLHFLGGNQQILSAAVSRQNQVLSLSLTHSR